MEAQPNSRYDDLVKLSADPSIWDNILQPSPADAASAGQRANAEMWKWILAAAGLGALGRTGLGALRLGRQESGFSPTPSFQSIGIMMPEEEEEAEKTGMDKEAVPNPGAWLYDKLKGATEDLPWGESTFWGRQASSPYSNPALWTLGLPAAMVSGYGGWKLVDKILDWRRRQELDSELEGAKDEYEQLLNATLAKQSADDTSIEQELDDLAEIVTEPVEKQAAISDIPSQGLGMLLSYAMLSALASGKLSYDYFKKRNERLIAEEALKRRAKERFGGTTPIQLKPSTELA